MKVEPHTSLKHRMLGAYFKICRQVAKNRPLYYVDLYSGDGEAECDEAPIKKWKCPFIRSLLEHAKKGEIQLNCFLNELDRGNYEVLKKNVGEYEKFIIGLTQNDANIAYRDALAKVPNSSWSIFFLDPCKYSELDWKTIEGLSKHTGNDPISKCVRKPELIINLMTITMQRAFKSDPEGITKSLGGEEWKERVENMSKTGEKAHEIFSDIFTRKLETLGYYVNPICVTQTPPNSNVLYYMIFASSIPNANEIIAKKYKPYIDGLMRDKWVKENFVCRMMMRARKNGNSLLGDFAKKDKDTLC